jgi:hypothetical protein
MERPGSPRSVGVHLERAVDPEWIVPRSSNDSTHYPGYSEGSDDEPLVCDKGIPRISGEEIYVERPLFRFMPGSDPYTPAESHYECTVCGGRTVSDGHVGQCPDCGEAVRNLSVPRE